VIRHMGKLFRAWAAGARQEGRFRRGTFLACTRVGSTLVEIAVVVAIVSVLAAIGWGLFQDRVTSHRMIGVSKMLYNDIVTLRSLAVDSNRETRLLLVEGDEQLDPEDAQHGAWRLQMGDKSSGSTEWDTLPPDRDGVVSEADGIRSLERDGENETTAVSLAMWSTLEDDAIVFTPRGWVGNRASDFDSGYITLSLVNKRALADGIDERGVLRIARSGFVRLELGQNSALADGAVGSGATSR